jgi:hypothetical protein
MGSRADFVFDPGIAFPHIRMGKVEVARRGQRESFSFSPGPSHPKPLSP